MVVRFSVIALLTVFAACSSTPPPGDFLNASLRITTVDNNGSVVAETLRIKPADLFNAFDTNVVSRKWKREGEDSWSFVFKGKDPRTQGKNTIVITLERDPDHAGEVAVRKIIANGAEQPLDAVAVMMRQLDEGLSRPR